MSPSVMLNQQATDENIAKVYVGVAPDVEKREFYCVYREVTSALLHTKAHTLPVSHGVLCMYCNFFMKNIDNMYFACLTDDTTNTVNMVHEFKLSSDFFDKIESLY